MKKTILILSAIAVVLASCTSIKVKTIGQVSVVATRNFSTKENYVNLKSYSELSKRELKNNKSKTVQDAINETVKSVPGGEFMENVTIYLVSNGTIAVSGDVYGLTANNYKGFAIGDRVLWKDNFVKYTGTITNLSNDKECIIKQDENGKIRTVGYEELKKIE